MTISVVATRHAASQAISSIAAQVFQKALDLMLGAQDSPAPLLGLCVQSHSVNNSSSSARPRPTASDDPRNLKYSHTGPVVHCPISQVRRDVIVRQSLTLLSLEDSCHAGHTIKR